MIPDFALSLSFEGISLLHRTPEGWSSLGEVPLDSRDLGAELVRLQRAGMSSGTPWRGTRVLLPPEQVRVVTLDGILGEAEARAALDGLTPYPVSDLVIDVVHQGGRTHVAAVARDTLAEAEAFADEHGFAPVCFGAALGSAGFPGEAFFGATATAAGILGDEPVERDPTALGPDAVPLDTSAKPIPEIVPVTDATPVARPDPVDEVPEPEPEPLAQSAAPPPAADAPETAASAGEAAADLAAAEPASGADLPAGAPTPAGQPPAGKGGEPESAPLSATGVPEPVFASRARPLTGQTRGLGPAAEAAPDRASGPAEPPVAKPLQGASPAGWALSAPPAGRSDPRLPPRAPGPVLSVPIASAPIASAPVASAAVASIAVASAPPKAEVIEAPLREPVRATPKAQALRRGPFAPGQPVAARQRIGGKPRFLGLILTAILLVLMATAALFAAGPDRIAGLFRLAEPAATEVALASATGTGPVGTTSATAMAPEAVTSPITAPLPQPDEGAARTPRTEAPAPEAVASALPRPTTQDEPAQAPARPAARSPALSPAASEAASVAVAAAIAALPARDDPGAATAEASATRVDPAEAERFYAATGVWLRAPRPPVLPEVGSAAAPDLPTAALAKALPDLPSLAALSPDALPKAGPAPAPASVVVAGLPARIPPTRPASETADEPVVASAMARPPSVRVPVRPEPPAGALSTALSPPDAEEAATAWVNARPEAPAARIPARPEAPPALLAALEATGAATRDTLTSGALPSDTLAFAAMPGPDDAPATMGGVSLAGLRPTPRPEGFAPELPEAPPTVLSSFDGPRPGPRPDDLAPEDLPTADVSGALAEALAPPEAPAELEAPPEPDLQSALAAIVEGAPDPLAGATRQAVALARVPDVRPSNFGRVVESQLARAARANPAPASRAPAGGTGTGGLAAHEEAESGGEAEVASSAAAVPSGPTATTVAQSATFADAIALREINLIGVYGQPNARRALVRLGNGRYLRVGVGDALDGGQVTAIGDNALNYVRRGRTFALVIPGG